MESILESKARFSIRFGISNLCFTGTGIGMDPEYLIMISLTLNQKHIYSL